MNRLYVVALVLGLLLLVVVVELLRRRQLREKYAALWIVVGVSSLVLAVLPAVLIDVAVFLGFQVPANMLFLLAAIVLTTISMQLSLEAGHREDETQRLGEEVALLRLEIQRLAIRDCPLSDGGVNGTRSGRVVPDRAAAEGPSSVRS